MSQPTTLRAPRPRVNSARFTIACHDPADTGGGYDVVDGLVRRRWWEPAVVVRHFDRLDEAEGFAASLNEPEADAVSPEDRDWLALQNAEWHAVDPMPWYSDFDCSIDGEAGDDEPPALVELDGLAEVDAYLRARGIEVGRGLPDEFYQFGGYPT